MSIRNFGLAIGVAAALAAGGEARAQFGVGYYPGGYGGAGWGGWGGTTTTDTAQGDIARGLGAYTRAAGAYNQQTAVADSIDTNTVMRWNQYVYQSQLEQNRRYYARREARLDRQKEASDEYLRRIREKPDTRDIERGDALNAVLDQLNDPKIHTSSIRMAAQPVESKLIRDIPFFYASQAMTISLNELAGEKSWPVALNGEAYGPDREAYKTAVAAALEKGDKGDLAPEDIRPVREAVARIKARFDKNPPMGKSAMLEGQAYIRTLAGMSKMLQKPEIEHVLAELDKVPNTTLGNLLGFMHTFNLRFAAAETPRQEQAYRQLYPMLVETRAKVFGKRDADVKEAQTGQAPQAERPGDFFGGIPSEYLYDDGTPKTGPVPRTAPAPGTAPGTAPDTAPLRGTAPAPGTAPAAPPSPAPAPNPESTPKND